MLVLAQPSPPLPQSIDDAYAPIYGFYVSTEERPVSVTANGQQMDVSISDRSDLFKVYPGHSCKGFYAVYEARPGEDKVEFVVRVGDVEIGRQSASVTPSALSGARESALARERNRAFVLRNLICVGCGGSLAGGEQPNTCAHCGTDFDCSTRAVSAVPLAAYRIPKAINTSFCVYDLQENELIEAARAAGGKVLDFGAGLRRRTDEALISVEIADMPSIDLVSVGDRIPFADNTFESAMTLHVLEHVKKPWEIARELIRVVKPGGAILSTVPYVCPVHGFPYHFFSMTPMGLRSLFDGCEIVSHTMKPDAHPINGIKQLLSTYAGSISGGARDQFGRVTVEDLVGTELGILLQAPWAGALNEAAKWEMPAHSTLIVKTPG